MNTFKYTFKSKDNNIEQTHNWMTQNDIHLIDDTKTHNQ